jgi:hypothetical protein
MGAFNADDVGSSYFKDYLTSTTSGFYAANAFIEGKVYLPNAGITNEGDEDDSIRIWAGASA